jgi:hypothetical protein
LELGDYQICQRTINDFSIQVLSEQVDKNKLIAHLNQIFEKKGCEVPDWHWQRFEKRETHLKRRRIISNLNMRDET